MPVLNGYQTTIEMRNCERQWGRYVPIIAMTAHAFEDEINKCLDVGMDGCLMKPIEPQLALSTVLQYLHTEPLSSPERSKH